MCTAAAACAEEDAVNIESVALLAICFLLTVYLVWALLRPEDF
jgi:K+-transporting ATPase KdpF subunit